MSLAAERPARRRVHLIGTRAPAVLQRRAERHRGERRADALDRRIEPVEGGAPGPGRRSRRRSRRARRPRARRPGGSCARPTPRSRRGRAARACAGRSPRPRSRPRTRGARRRQAPRCTSRECATIVTSPPVAQRDRARRSAPGSASSGTSSRAEVERLVLDEHDRVGVGDRAQRAGRRRPPRGSASRPSARARASASSRGSGSAAPPPRWPAAALRAQHERHRQLARPT